MNSVQAFKQTEQGWTKRQTPQWMKNSIEQTLSTAGKIYHYMASIYFPSTNKEDIIVKGYFCRETETEFQEWQFTGAFDRGTFVIHHSEKRP